VAEKDQAAVALVRKRWDKLSPEERSEIARELGRASGRARRKKARERRRLERQAATAA